MKELAEFLKGERLSKGVTMDEISQRTSLSKNVLTAMEEGDFKKIGTPLLIRRFVAAYCTALGVEGEALLRKYVEEIDSFDWQQEGLDHYAHMQRIFRTRSQWGISIPLALFVLTAALIYGGITLYEKRETITGFHYLKNGGYPQQEIPSDLSQRSSPADGRDPAAAKEAGEQTSSRALAGPGSKNRTEAEGSAGTREAAGSPQAGTSRVSGGEGPTQSVKAPPEPPSPAHRSGEGEVLPASQQAAVVQEGPSSGPTEQTGMHRLQVEAAQEAWIQVRIDKTTTQSALLKPGESREWTARETLQVVVGNAGGVTMKWDGRPLELPRKRGSVQKFRLPDPQLVKEE